MSPPRRVFTKVEWQNAVGIEKKPKRLKLVLNSDSKFYCPVKNCETNGYLSQRGCRKHIFQRHGWVYFFDEKPDLSNYFPELNTRNSKIPHKAKRSNTSKMPMFLSSCSVAVTFVNWLRTPGGGGKNFNQSDQICHKVLKYLQFCCSDVCTSLDIPVSVVDYCMGSVSIISEFVTCLQDEWNIGFSGVIGYMNALCHVLDLHRSAIIDTKPFQFSLLWKSTSIE